jgi:hypothetical protein
MVASIQWILPLNAGKSHEIRIRRVNLSIQFDRQRCKMRVGGQVASPPASAQVGKKEFTVPGAWINNPNDSALQPGLHMTSRHVNRHRIFEDPRIGPQPNEAKSH